MAKAKGGEGEVAQAVFNLANIFLILRAFLVQEQITIVEVLEQQHYPNQHNLMNEQPEY